MKQYDETDHRDDATTASAHDDSDTLDSIIDEFPQDVTFPDDTRATAETDDVRDDDDSATAGAATTESSDAPDSFDSAEPVNSSDTAANNIADDDTDTDDDKDDINPDIADSSDIDRIDTKATGADLDITAKTENEPESEMTPTPDDVDPHSETGADPVTEVDTNPVDTPKTSDGGEASDASAHRFADAFATMKSGLSALAPVGRAIRTVWNKRPKLSFALYAIVFIVVTAYCVLALQWSAYTEPTYAEDSTVDADTRIRASVAGQLTKFVSQVWLEQKYQFVLNFLVLGLIYLVLIFLINRFWISTAIFTAVFTIFAIASKFKIQLRNEPIIPADLDFLSSGNTGKLISFVPEDQQTLIWRVATIIVTFVLICCILQFIDRRNGLFPCHWRPSRFVNVKNIIAIVTRCCALLLSSSLLFAFVWNLSVTNSWAQQWASSLSDEPVLWDSMADVRNNGPAMSFLRLVHVNTMDMPESYSKATMQDLAERYSLAADAINASRTSNLTDSTVIFVLSETLSDPTRVPGVELGIDPMPNIRSIKETTTSGLMLSPGYGGGTANIEFQALTGMNLANFDSSMLVPYQQLLPHMQQVYSFNQLWNDAYGEDASIALHPYYKNLYLRDSNYEKMGFSSFRTLDSTPALTYQETIDSSPYVSDAAVYQEVLDIITDQSSDNPQFIQLVTMQNHTPYNDYYADNEFKDADFSQLSDEERYQIDTYAKGVSYTDQATASFLEQLDQIDEPITVVFYGDHLPGIYSTAASDSANSITLHETDYFIWSNSASPSSNTKLPTESTSYTSSNFFMEMAAEHMNACVSPFLAMLSAVRQEVPAMSRVIAQTGGIGEGTATYLDMFGNEVDPTALSEYAQSLINDYLLVQYDMTAGEGYLRDTAFYDVPEAQNVTLTKNPVPGSGFTTETPMFEQYVAEQPLY